MEKEPNQKEFPVNQIIKGIDEICASLGYAHAEPEISEEEIIFALDGISKESTYRDLAQGLIDTVKLDYSIDIDAHVEPNQIAGYDIVVKMK